MSTPQTGLLGDDKKMEKVQTLRKLFATSDVPNDPKAWDQAWVDSLTPWDASESQPALMELLNGLHDKDVSGISNVVPSGNGVALVAGCGRGYDAKVFAERGLDAYGVDISSNAVAAANKWLKDSGADESVASRVHFVEADFFKLGTSECPHQALAQPATVTLSYDYTFLCAIPPTLRASWAETYTRMVKPGGILVSLVYPIQGDRPGGPPYSISTNLVRELLGQNKTQAGKAAWEELADLEPKQSKETRVGIERVMIWKRLE